MYIYEKPFFRSTLFHLQHDTQIMEIRHSCTVLQIGCLRKKGLGVYYTGQQTDLSLPLYISDHIRLLYRPIR